MPSQVRLFQGAILVLVGASGFAAGRGMVPSGEDAVLKELARLRDVVEAQNAPASAPPQVRCAVAPSASAPVDMAALRSEVAQVLREELASRAGSAPKPEPWASPSPPPQAVAAHQEALRLIDEASRTRQWREQDALAARQLLTQMTDSQRKEVVRRISATLNAGGIDVQVHGPPY
jgi:hypothetical protein